MVSNLDTKVKESLEEWLDPEAFSFWAVLDSNENIVIDKKFDIVHDNQWIKSLSHEEQSDIMKQLKPETPVKIHELANYTIASFHQEPPLYLITEKKKNNSCLKCLAELLYEKIYLGPRNNEKIEGYDAFSINLDKISKLKKDIRITSMGRAIEKLFEIIDEKYKINHIAIYHKQDNKANFIYKYLAGFPKQKEVKEKLNLKNKLDENRDGHLKQLNEKKLQIFFHKQSIVFILSRNAEEKLPTDQSTLLEKYLQLSFLGILPFLENIVNWQIARELIGSLSMELYDSITSAQFLISKLQKVNENSRGEAAYNAINQLERQIYNLEYRLSAYAKKNFNYPGEFTSLNIKSLIRQALQQHPELEKNYTVNTDLQENLYVYVHESAMLAVLNEIFKNILQHAFKDSPVQEKEKKIVEIIARKTVTEEQEYLHLTIRDYGRGLKNADEINSVFEPGWKGEKQSPNAGMGLSFAYFVVTDVHCGDIKADTPNKPLTGFGKGFSLIIALPLDNKTQARED